MGCLYRLKFPSGKSYIGVSASTAEERFKEHVYNASIGRGRAVNRAIAKYGAAAIEVETLAVARDYTFLLELERRAIALFGTMVPGGYNMTAGGDGALGYRHTEDALRKIGDTHRGKAHHCTPHTEEAKAKMRAAALGRKASAETRAKRSAASIGNKYSLGRTWSEEQRAAQSARLTGIDRGDAWRAKMSAVATQREATKRQNREADHGR